MRTDALDQLLRRKQTIGFHDGSFAMYPLGFDRVEPETLRRQTERQDTHPFAGLLDLLIVFSDPGANDLTDMPRGVVPDQQPGCFALSRQMLAAPVEKLGGDVTYGASGDKTQPHLVTHGIIGGTSLPKDSIAGERFGIGIAFFPGFFHQMHGLFCVLPRVHTRQGKATPPHLIEEANGPLGLLTGPGDQPVASVFFPGTAGGGGWRRGGILMGWLAYQERLVAARV